MIKEMAKGHFVDLDKLNDESVIVDAGAAWGDTIEALRTFRQTERCRIFAFECHREHIKTLEEKRFFNVTLYKKALVGQNVPGSVTFYQHNGLPGWGNITKPLGRHHRKFKGIVAYEVETLRINDLFGTLGLNEIDYLKMDIEGSEREILETMSEETASRIKQMSIEYHTFLGMTRECTERHLERLGFEIKKRKNIELFCERRDAG